MLFGRDFNGTDTEVGTAANDVLTGRTANDSLIGGQATLLIDTDLTQTLT